MKLDIGNQNFKYLHFYFPATIISRQYPFITPHLLPASLIYLPRNPQFFITTLLSARTRDHSQFGKLLQLLASSYRLSTINILRNNFVGFGSREPKLYAKVSIFLRNDILISFWRHLWTFIMLRQVNRMIEEWPIPRNPKIMSALFVTSRWTEKLALRSIERTALKRQKVTL